jgi:hypothetical protein
MKSELIDDERGMPPRTSPAGPELSNGMTALIGPFEWAHGMIATSYYD